MKEQFLTWREKHRDRIGSILVAIGIVVRLFVMMLTRTLGTAGLMFAYLFYTATPETTVYQLAQIGHRDGFWLVAFMIASLYTVVFYAVNGPATSHWTAAAAGIAASGHSFHLGTTRNGMSAPKR